MWPRATPAFLQRQAGLRPIQRMDLALLINRKHHRFFRGIQAQPDHISQFLSTQRILRDLEPFDLMRLELVGTPNAMHRGLRDAKLLRQGPAAPVGGVSGNAGHGQCQDFLDFLLW